MSFTDQSPDIAVEAYKLAVERMLVRFHHFDADDAWEMIEAWCKGGKPEEILMREPFMTAAALAGENVEDTNARVERDGPEAAEIESSAVIDAKRAAAKKTYLDVYAKAYEEAIAGLQAGVFLKNANASPGVGWLKTSTANYAVWSGWYGGGVLQGGGAADITQYLPKKKGGQLVPVGLQLAGSKKRA